MKYSKQDRKDAAMALSVCACDRAVGITGTFTCDVVRRGSSADRLADAAYREVYLNSRGKIWGPPRDIYAEAHALLEDGWTP